MKKKYLLIIIILTIILTSGINLVAQEMCVYIDKSGAFKQVNSREKVPAAFRKSAKCFKQSQKNHLAKPDEIELKGNVREIDMSSSIGRMELKWPRKVETLFGRTPQRALADAARSVSRAIKSAGFPSKLRTMNLDWKVIFLDAELPSKQIPSYLVSNCHPAWMTPPANIYVVAQRVVAGCSGQNVKKGRVNDAQLAEVLLHEIGHAVENQLIGGSMGGDKKRSEGFATWFESFSSDFSTVIKDGSVKKEHFDLARTSFRHSPTSFYFQGSAYDYARASMYFHSVYSKRKVYGIVDLYDLLKEKRLPIREAVKETMKWTDKRLNEQIGKLLGS